MWLYRHLRHFLGWTRSILWKIVRLAPLSLLTAVIATLTSQLSLLLASFLPLKIILLIGSTGVPRYFPKSFGEIDKEQLALWLGAAAIGFYILHLLAERVVTSCNEGIADRVLKRARKLALFENELQIAHEACRKLANGMATAILVVVTLVATGFLHLPIMLLLVGWCIGAFLLVSVAGEVKPAYRGWMEARARGLINGWVALGVFSVMALVIVEFLLGATFNILIVVVSLILARQLLQRLSASLKDALALSGQKPQILALFFHSHVFSANAAKKTASVWKLSQPDHLAEWLPTALTEATGNRIDEVQLTAWRETTQTETCAFEVAAVANEGHRPDFLIKLFDKRRRMLSAHEAALLGAVPAGSLPCLPFLGTVQVGESTCHVFSKPDALLPAPEDRRRSNALEKACALVEPPEELVQRYRRSHHLLPRRLSTDMGEWLLKIELDPGAQRTIRLFIEAVDPIVAALERLPLAICNTASDPEALLETEDGNLVVLDWSRWSLEPIGAGWTVAASKPHELRAWLKDAETKRPALASVQAEHIKLAALTFAFEQSYSRQRYGAARKRIPAILSCASQAGLLSGENAGREQKADIVC